MMKKIAIIALAAIVGAAILVAAVAVLPSDNSGKCTVEVEAGTGITSVSGSGDYEEDSSCTVSATLTTGYVFSGWYDEQGALVSSEQTYTFTVTNSVALTAKAEITVELTYIADSGITSVSGGGTYIAGSSCTVSAEVSEGYGFVGWYNEQGILISNEQTYTFTVTNSVALTAKAGILVNLTYITGNGVESVDGPSSAPAGKEIAVTVTTLSGYTMLGWYDNLGNFSTGSTYTVSEESSTITCVAYCDDIVSASDGTLTFTNPLGSGCETATWTVENADVCNDSETFTYTDASFTEEKNAGKYTVTFSGTMSCGLSVTVTETVINDTAVHFEWTYNGQTYEYDWNISYAEYSEYRYMNTDSRSPSYIPGNTSSYDAAVEEFITVSTDSLSDIIEMLRSESEGMTDLQRADFVLKFVQSTEYVSDSDSRGTDDWYKYGIETLYEHGGDCEDTAMLYCALMSGLGYKTTALVFLGMEYYGRGHMAAAVCVSGASGSYYLIDGDKYYWAETTNDADVGQQSSGYNTAHAILIDARTS